MRRPGTPHGRRGLRVAASAPGGLSPSQLGATLWLPPPYTGTPIDTAPNVGTAGGSFTGSGATRPNPLAVGARTTIDYERGDSSRLVSTLTLSQVISASAYSWAYALRLESLPSGTSDTPAWYVNEGALVDSGQFFGAHLRNAAGTAKVIAAHWDGAQQGREDDVPGGVGALVLVRADFGGGTLTLRSGSRTPVTDAAGDVQSLAGTMISGADATLTTFADGVVGDLCCFNRQLAAGEWSSLVAWYRGLYPGIDA